MIQENKVPKLIPNYLGLKFAIDDGKAETYARSAGKDKKRLIYLNRE
jgi:hypothetical protein